MRCRLWHFLTSRHIKNLLSVSSIERHTHLSPFCFVKRICAFVFSVVAVEIFFSKKASSCYLFRMFSVSVVFSGTKETISHPSDQSMRQQASQDRLEGRGMRECLKAHPIKNVATVRKVYLTIKWDKWKLHYSQSLPSFSGWQQQSFHLLNAQRRRKKSKRRKIKKLELEGKRLIPFQITFSCNDTCVLEIVFIMYF